MSLYNASGTPLDIGLENAIFQEQSVIYVYVALAAAVVYDHITTLDLEVELIWMRSRLSVVQLLFLVNRYVGDGILLYAAAVLKLETTTDSRRKCFAVDQVKGWGNWAVLWSMQGIMIYRVSSMYYHSRKMICLLVSCFVVEIAITSTMQSLPYDVVFGSGHLTSCVEKVFPRWYRVFWTPIILFESLIFGVSIFKGIRFYKSASTINGIIHTSLGRKSLMYTLLRDSILFPFIALILCFLNVIGWGYFSFTTIVAIVAISGFMARLLGCRLILNLREAYYRPFEEELGQERLGSKDTLHHGDCDVGEEMVRISPA